MREGKNHHESGENGSCLRSGNALNVDYHQNFSDHSLEYFLPESAPDMYKIYPISTDGSRLLCVGTTGAECQILRKWSSQLVYDDSRALSLICLGS